ncbi:MAG: M48 family metallopeptidase, partial [Clostridia bacterium]|nr:M48 family metallopeptidase [Clostridia bacterium]
RIPRCVIKVKKQKRMWGSCNTGGRIYINSRISMCRPEAVEYILWHEISHLAHMNHSRDFYRLLESYCPGYKMQKAWLRANAPYLRI